MIELLKISLVAYIFTVLTWEGKIFHFYRKLIDRLPDWLFKPLGGCHMCFTGQVCFWYYLIFIDGYNFFDHLFFASAGIFLSMAYHALYKFLSSCE